MKTGLMFLIAALALEAAGAREIRTLTNADGVKIDDFVVRAAPASD